MVQKLCCSQLEGAQSTPQQNCQSKALFLKTPRQRLGRAAEDLAARHLQKQGFAIAARNYRHQRAEVDLIVQKDTLLLFVAVKARSSDQFGYPEEFVSALQQERLQEAAEHYIVEHNWRGAIRFDVVAVYTGGSPWEVAHFEDAF